MASVVALGAVTGGINLTASDAELRELGLTPGGFSLLSVEHMEELRRAVEKKRGSLPPPNGGGSIANTAALLARAGVSCGLIGVAGDDDFGRLFVSHFEKVSLEFLSSLEAGATTGYDFYFYGEDGALTIALTHGANALLSPDRIDLQAIEGAQLALLDGGALSFGPESRAAVSMCAQRAEAAGIPYVLTLASVGVVEEHRDFFASFGPNAQMVVGNLEQAAALMGLAADASLEHVRAELAKTSMDAVITLDVDGAFARFGEEEFVEPTQKQDAVDPVGAGDNFLASFLFARQRGLSVDQALAVGNIVSGEVIRRMGAQLPMGLDVPRLLQDAVEMAQRQRPRG